MSANWPWPPDWRLWRACAGCRSGSSRGRRARRLGVDRDVVAPASCRPRPSGASRPGPRSGARGSRARLEHSEGSSSPSLCRAPESLTSSLRFLAVTPGRTPALGLGAVRGRGDTCGRQRAPPDSAPPASATISPASASLILSRRWPNGRSTPPTRCRRRSGPRQAAATRHGRAKLAGMALVQGLEALRHGLAVGRQRAPPGGLGAARRVVAQRLEQAAHAVLGSAAPIRTGTTWSAPNSRAGRGRSALLGRAVLEQLLEQLVVEVGERLQHLAAGLALARQDLGRHWIRSETPLAL